MSQIKYFIKHSYITPQRPLNDGGHPGTSERRPRFDQSREAWLNPRLALVLFRL